MKTALIILAGAIGLTLAERAAVYFEFGDLISRTIIFGYLVGVIQTSLHNSWGSV